MISSLHLKSASSAGQPNLSVAIAPSITIFVGPNNSGKSQILREIGSFCCNGTPGAFILDRLDFVGVELETAKSDYDKIKRKPELNENIQADHSAITIAGSKRVFHDQTYFAVRVNPSSGLQRYAQYYMAHQTLELDGKSRMGLIAKRGMGDLEYPTEPIAKIYINDESRLKWRSTVFDAFGTYPGISSLQQGQLAVKFGSSPPPSERTHFPEIIEWMKAALPAEEISDGVKAFSGILLQVYAGDPKVIIIDEPEAFLHPSLARKLGKELAEAARVENKFVFVATHSAEFVMGAIQSGASINIIRLTFANGNATARLLPNDDLIPLMQNPMLRSVGVLSGLFFDHVIVTEADTDRAFYQEINERLIAAKDPRAIQHALFLNADNHQTIPAIVTPLRKIGIPAAGIADIDVLKLGGIEWSRQLDAAGLPESQKTSLGQQRKTVLDSLKAAAPEGTSKPEEYFKTSGGITILEKSEKEAAENLFNQLDQYGFFIVRNGEVEAWLASLNVPAKSNGWRTAIFGAMGHDPADANYVKPTDGDVWDFIGSIGKWLKDPAKRGIPS